MAEGILKYLAIKNNLTIEVRSAGTHAAYNLPPSPLAVEAMKDLGIDISSYKSYQVDEKILMESDLVLTMSNTHKKLLLNKYPSIKDKVFLLNEYALGTNSEIEDPFGAPLRYYERARDQIYEAIEEIMGKLNNGR